MDCKFQRCFISELFHDSFNKNFHIPDYQRPYLWQSSNMNTLLQDISKALKNNQEEYRLGTLILLERKHKDDDKGWFDIVDGQQRIITLFMMLINLSGNDNKAVYFNKVKISKSTSSSQIVNNYKFIQQRFSKYIPDEKKKLFNYILNNCSFIVITTSDDAEAFQFFDSQNSRGKALKPHDLLKAYHLREMEEVDEACKISLIKQWEDYDDRYLSELFADYLYPIIKWSRGSNGLYYSKDEIHTFKG